MGGTPETMINNGGGSVKTSKKISGKNLGLLVILLVGLTAIAAAVKWPQLLWPKAAGPRRSAPTASVLYDLNYRIDKVFGQPDDKETMNNRIVPNRGFQLAGVHVDRQNRIYVYDSANNRILGFNGYSLNKPPDIVIGQPGLSDKGTANGDNTRYLPPTESTLALIPYPQVPSTQEGGRMGQMASDDQGNFYVVDLNNNRVLKFDDPFNIDRVADRVWGQTNFTSRQSHCGQAGYQPTAATICTEWGTQFNGTDNQIYLSAVEVDSKGNVWVADTGNHRVLRFPKISINAERAGAGGQPADLVLGQTDFVSRGNRGAYDFDLDKMIKPIGLKFDPVSGELYVLEGEFSGQNRVMVFKPPFFTGMPAIREFGRAQFQDDPPPDTTNWQEIGGKWVHVTTGMYWPRGIAVDPQGNGVWVNDSSNQRIVRFDRKGKMAEVIGQPDFETRGCWGWQNQGYIDHLGNRVNSCDPEGEIGIDRQGRMYISFISPNDPRNIARFLTPIRRNQQGLAISDGALLSSGFNQVTGKTVENAYGMAVLSSNSLKLSNSPGVSQQLFVSDNQRILVWDDFLARATFSEADYAIGQDNFGDNRNNPPLFPGLFAAQQTVGGGYLWVTLSDRIYAFKLPIIGGGQEYPVDKILYTGPGSFGNVFWADDQQKVEFRAHGLVFDEVAGALWVADELNNRVFRILNPMSSAKVDIVIGQPDKNSICDNACIGSGPNRKGFADPWAVRFDHQGNLYVVDAKYEGGSNNRVLRFNTGDIVPVEGNIFPFPDAAGVYAKKGFDTTENWGPHTPATPVWVEFDSQNRMIMLVDSYGNLQYERAYIYLSSHVGQEMPRPRWTLPLAFGQGSMAYFYPDDNHLIIQDHTWSRILFVTLESGGSVKDLPLKRVGE